MLDKDEIIDYFDNICRNIELEKYIKIDNPFYMGKIGDFDTGRIIPSSFLVETITDLSF